MQFSSDHILLGRTGVGAGHGTQSLHRSTVKYNPGDYCFMFSEQPVTALVPNAAQGSGKTQRCTYGGQAGDCFTGGSTTNLPPEASATWRYLLEGDFHFTHPGTYPVELTSHPGKVLQADRDKLSSPVNPMPVTQTLKLEVMPKDDAALLAREKQMAAELEAEILHTQPMPAAPEEREARRRAMENVRRIRSGLAAQPTPGYGDRL